MSTHTEMSVDERNRKRQMPTTERTIEPRNDPMNDTWPRGRSKKRSMDSGGYSEKDKEKRHHAGVSEYWSHSAQDVGNGGCNVGGDVIKWRQLENQRMFMAWSGVPSIHYSWSALVACPRRLCSVTDWTVTGVRPVIKSHITFARITCVRPNFCQGYYCTCRLWN